MDREAGQGIRKVLVVSGNDNDYRRLSSILQTHDISCSPKQQAKIEVVRVHNHDCTESFSEGSIYDALIIDPDRLSDETLLRWIRFSDGNMPAIICTYRALFSRLNRLNILCGLEVVFKEDAELLLSRTIHHAIYYYRTLNLIAEKNHTTPRKIEFLQTLLEDLGDGIVVLDQEFRINYANKVALDLLCRSPRELLGSKLEIDPNKTRQEIAVKDPEGNPRFIELVSSHNYSKKNKVNYLVLRDISSRKKTEDKLKLFAKKLEENNKKLSNTNDKLKRAQRNVLTATSAKESFFANMSHEIRTPLSAIISYSEGLLDKNFCPQEREKSLKAINRNGKHLLQLVNNVLDISKLESGNFQLKSEWCNAEKLIQEAVHLLDVKLKAKGLDIELKCCYPLPSKILVDPLRVRQVLLNLLDNAIKHSDRGTIGIKVEYSHSHEEFFISISDQGPGIASKDAEKIFDRFAQAERSDGKIKTGTGLGLPISRRLARVMKGDVTFRNNSATGATFTFSFHTPITPEVTLREKPLYDYSSLAQKRLKMPEKLKGTILLAEDNEDTRRVTKLFMEHAGLSVIEAVNGKEALDLARNSDFDLLLLDMRMPELNGYEVSSKLRNDGETRPIIAFTANTYAEEVSRAFSSGCNGYLAKPFEREDLLFTLLEFLPDANSCALPEEEEENSDKQKTESTEGAPIPTLLYEIPEGPEVLLGFISHLEEHCTLLKTASKQNDNKKIEEIAHKLKASSAFGYQELANKAALVVDCIRKNTGSNIEMYLEELFSDAESIIASRSFINEELTRQSKSSPENAFAIN